MFLWKYTLPSWFLIIVFHSSSVKISEILNKVSKLGYRPRRRFHRLEPYSYLLCESILIDERCICSNDKRFPDQKFTVILRLKNRCQRKKDSLKDVEIRIGKFVNK